MVKQHSLNKTKQHKPACIRNGLVSAKTTDLSFANRMAKRKAEDREIERLRDERLAALIRK